MPSGRRKVLRFSAPTAPPPRRWDWEDVVPSRGREPRRDGGVAAVATRLANLPFPAINETFGDHVHYTAVPQEAAPRMNRGERQLHNRKGKIEVAFYPIMNRMRTQIQIT